MSRQPSRASAPRCRSLDDLVLHGGGEGQYLALSHVSEACVRRLRMSELVHLANGSLFRLSNVVKRFEQRRWIERFPDPDDGRFTFAAPPRPATR